MDISNRLRGHPSSMGMCVIESSQTIRTIVSNPFNSSRTANLRRGPEFFREHIDALEKAFEGYPVLQKLAVNVFIGLQGRLDREVSFSYLSMCAAEAAGMRLQNSTGYDCHVWKFGKFDDGRSIWQADFVSKCNVDNVPYCVYKQTLEMEAVELHKMTRIITDEHGST